MITTRQILFNRVELKYLVDRTTRTALAKDVSAFIPPDAHTEGDKGYLVRSIYFDTVDFMAYHQKVAGMPVRHKLRVRIYGEDLGKVAFVRLEVKSKYLSITHKITVDFPKAEYAEIERAIARRTMPPTELLDREGISKEFFRLMKQYNMEPKIMVQYRRRALERTAASRLRINFDDECMASRNLDLFGPLRSARSVLKYNSTIFEIKADGSIPFWLHQLISKYELQNQAVSKFCHAIRSEARFSSIGRATETSEALLV